MRTEQNRDGTYKVWMTREEYHVIPQETDDWEHEIAFRLMGGCGLRRSEVLDVRPKHISRMSDGRHFTLEVVSGKDTSGEFTDGKHRETWMSVDFERGINRYIQHHDIDDDEPLISCSKRTLLDWVDKATTRTARVTGDNDYLRVSSHDFRRCWANHLLVERNVSPRIVMAFGGWNSYDAIEPYLTEPTEENIIETMSSISL